MKQSKVQRNGIIKKSGIFKLNKVKYWNKFMKLEAWKKKGIMLKESSSWRGMKYSCINLWKLIHSSVHTNYFLYRHVCFFNLIVLYIETTKATLCGTTIYCEEYLFSFIQYQLVAAISTFKYDYRSYSQMESGVPEPHPTFFSIHKCINWEVGTFFTCTMTFTMC